MFHLFLLLTVFFGSIILLIIFLVPQWEKITDVLNGIMDWATSLFSSKKQKTESVTPKQNNPSSVKSNTTSKKKLPFWMQIQRVSPYKKTTALLLCLPGFMFVGGLQRIYVRSWFTGIVFLVTGGLGGLGTIYDIVMILTGNFKDSNGLYLESEARRRWDSKNAKWRYVYWSIANGRYFVDATSIQQEDDIISCTYMVELNYTGKIPFKKMRLDTATYVLSYVTFQENGRAASVMVNKTEVLDAKGTIIYSEEVNSPWEIVEKDSMYECIYLAIENS